MTYSTIPTEYTTKGHTIMSSIWEKAKHDADMLSVMTALASTPADAEYVQVEVDGKAVALRFQEMGWEVVRDNRFDGGVYRAWIRKTVLRRKRSLVDLDTAAWRP